MPRDQTSQTDSLLQCAPVSLRHVGTELKIIKQVPQKEKQTARFTVERLWDWDTNTHWVCTSPYSRAPLPQHLLPEGSPYVIFALSRQ